MGLLTLSSTNPKFSYIINKNPLTVKEKNEPFRWSFRRGNIYGWFPDHDESKFRLWFQDNPVESSLANGAQGEFEYLDCSRYGSPYLPIGMIATALSTCAKTRSEYDTGDYTTTVETAIKVPRSIGGIDRLAEHFCAQGLSMDFDPITERYLNLRLTGTSVFQVLNVLQVLAVMQCFLDPDTYLRMDKTVMEKFIKVFNRADSPYYPRYLFQTKCMQDRGTFNKLKADLEAPGIVLRYGDTRMQRYDEIHPNLIGGKTLIDIGCGEMFYTLRKSNLYETVYAIDADEERSTNNLGKVEGRKIENIVTLCELVTPEYVAENADLFDGADVLLTEVIEHMEFSDGLALVEAILKTSFNKLIVTVPNSSFNKHYLMADECMRHHDHKWEPTFEQFCDEMATLAAATGTLEYTRGIGDQVDDECVSSMTVFTKKE